MDAADYIDADGLPPLTFRERIAVAWRALRGDFDPDRLEISNDGPAVAISTARRDLDSEAVVYALRARYRGVSVVGLGFHGEFGEGLAVVTPKGARSFAAGVLNIADAQDGTVPLFALNDREMP